MYPDRILFRQFLYSVLFWTATGALWGQSGAIDSLRLLLNNHPQRDSIRCEWLFQLGKAHVNGNNNQLINCAEELLNIARQTGLARMQMRAYNLLGVAYSRSGADVATALMYYDSAVGIATTQRGQDWRLSEAKILVNFAGVQLSASQPAEALKSARRSLALFMSFNDTLAIADNYRAQGQILFALDLPDSALFYARKAIPLYEAENSWQNLCQTYNDIGEFYRSIGKFDQAIAALQFSQKYADSLAAPSSHLHTLHLYGLTYKDMKSWAMAELFLRRALQMSLELNLSRIQETIHADIAGLFEQTGRPDSALYHFRQRQFLWEKRLDVERANQLNELETRYRVKTREQENVLLRTEKQLLQKQKEATWWSFLAVLLILAGLALGIWRIVLRRMREKSEELKAFNYSVGHDLRAPLQNARQWLEYLRADVTHNRLVEVQADMQYVSRSLDQLQEMLDGMLRWFTLEQNIPYYSNVDTQTLLEDICAQIGRTSGRASVEFQWKDLPVVRADQLMLRQIFENLISNALKFSAQAAQPQIRVFAREKPGGWQFEVSDNGVGFAPEHHAALFKLFKTVHPRDQFPGTGIGLAIVKRLVEKMGGTVEARSEGVGQGATVTFKLPK